MSCCCASSSYSLDEDKAAKAQEAYQRDELKLAVIYLKKLTAWERSSIALLVESAYTLWLRGLDGSADSSKSSVNEDDGAAIVQQSFGLLLSGKVDLKLVLPFDYIRLTHIYLAEGNLLGALKVLNSASTQGHMEDLLIVTQSCFILKELEKSKDCIRMYEYMISAVFQLSAALKSNEITPAAYYLADGKLPIYILFLLCAAYLQRSSNPSSITAKNTQNPFQPLPKTAQEKKKIMIDFQNLIIEAYFYCTLTKSSDLSFLLGWYNDPATWMVMGDLLNDTPFLLLAETCYWEVYLRQPLSDLALAKIISFMKKYHRGDLQHLPKFLAKALVVNPWNILARNTIVEIEKKVEKFPNNRKWSLLFEAERTETKKIQCHVKGWLLRKQWPVLYPMLHKKRQVFVKKMQLGEEKFLEAYFRYRQRQWTRWREYIAEVKALKWLCSIRLQSHWRMRSHIWSYRERLLSTKRANGLYLTLAQIVYDRKRAGILGKWHNKYTALSRQRASVILHKVMVLHRYNGMLRKGMNKLLGYMYIHHRYVTKDAWLFWQYRYNIRQRKHAFVSIRFFIRNTLHRIAEKAVEAQLQAVETVIAQKVELSLERNLLPMQREHWLIWRHKYLDRLKHYAVIRAVYTLQLALYRKKAKQRLAGQKIRKEIQFMACITYKQRLLRLYIKPWRILASTLRLQRFIRVSLARKKYHRLTHIDQEIHHKLADARVSSLQKTIFRWKKCVYLQKREKLRALRWIIYFFSKITVQSKLARLLIRHRASYNFLMRVHKASIKIEFYNFKNRLKYASRIQSLEMLFASLTVIKSKKGWAKFARQVADQSLVKRLERQMVEKKAVRLYGQTANASIQIIGTNNGSNKLVARTPTNHSSADTSSSSSTLALAGGIMSWEQYIPRLLKSSSSAAATATYRASLHSLALSIHQRKAFTVWMIAYRIQNQYKYNGAYTTAKRFQQRLIEQLIQRQVANGRIQGLYRRWKAQHRVDYYRKQAQRADELAKRTRITVLNQTFTFMHWLQQLRQPALKRLVSFFRMVVAIRKVAQLRKQRQYLREVRKMVNRSKFQQLIVKKAWAHWILAYLSRVYQGKYDLEEARRKWLRRQKLKSKQQTNKQKKHSNSKYQMLDETDLEEDEDDDEDDVNMQRFRQIDLYQSKLQAGNRPQAAEKAAVRKQLGKVLTTSKIGDSAINRFPSASALFFRSEDFHLHYHQLRTSNYLFVYQRSLHDSLQEQEIYFLLQSAMVLLIHEPTLLMLQFANNAFRGLKIILQAGSINSSSISGRGQLEQEQLLIDLCTVRKGYEVKFIDRGKWPLSLPHDPVIGIGGRKAGGGTGSATIATTHKQAIGGSLASNDDTSLITTSTNNKHRLSHLTQQAATSSSIIKTKKLPLHSQSMKVGKSVKEEEEHENDDDEVSSYGQPANADATGVGLVIHLEGIACSLFTVINIAKSLAKHTSASSLRVKTYQSYEQANKKGSSLTVTEPSSPAEKYLVELSIDQASCGWLGLLVMLLSLKESSKLRTLKITFSPQAEQQAGRTAKMPMLPDYFEVILDHVAKSTSLQDLRIFGCILSPACLSSLAASLQTHLVNLQRLEFSAACGSSSDSVSDDRLDSSSKAADGRKKSKMKSIREESIGLVQEIIQIGKNRSYSNRRQGVSVFVDKM